MKIKIVYSRPILERLGGLGTYLYNLLESYKKVGTEKDSIEILESGSRRIVKPTLLFRMVNYMAPKVSVKDNHFRYMFNN